MTGHRMDWQRQARTGTAEAVFCSGKSDDQIVNILEEARKCDQRLLLTRLSPEQHGRLGKAAPQDYEPASQTAILEIYKLATRYRYCCGRDLRSARSHGSCANFEVPWL